MSTRPTSAAGPVGPDSPSPLDRALTAPHVRRGLNLATATVVGMLLFTQVLDVPGAVLFIGVVTGSISALIAMGIVLVYRANRIINFAAGELGAVAGLLAALLQAGPGWGYLASAGAGLIAAVGLGALIEVLIIRRFATSSRLILTVATIGIAQLLVFAELFLPELFGSHLALFEVASPFDLSFTWDPVVFEAGHVVAVVVVAVIGLGMTLFLRRSLYGIAIRAASESADRASQLGIPTRRIGTLVWCMAAGLAGVASLLRGPLVGVPLGTVLGPGLLLRAMAAAVIARMDNLPRVFGAAVLLGAVEQAVVWRTGDAVVVDAVLFGVIIAGLLIQRRGQSRTDEPPSSSWDLVARVRGLAPGVRSVLEVRLLHAMLLATLVCLAVVVPVFVSPSRVNLLGAGMILAMILLSLTVLTGWAGEISLGQMALVGIGAATAAKTASLGWDFFACLAAAGAVGAAVSLAIGVPALRVRGPFLAVASFAFALATSSYFLNQSFFPSLIVSDRVERPVILGKFDLEHEHAFFYVVLILLTATVLSLASLRNSRTGRVLMAARDNAAAVQSYGVSLLRARLTGFAVSGFVAAVAGGTLTFHQHALSINQYRPERSLEIFSLAIFGGVGSIAGAVASAAYFTGLTYFVNSELAVLFVTAVGLLVILLLLPGGLSQVLFGLRDRAVRAVLGWPSHAPVAQPAQVAQPAMATTMARPVDDDSLLLVRRLDVSYGRLQVLFDVDVAVRDGEIVALLGTNGAGKSTLLKAVVGSVRPGAGTIRFDGDELSGSPEQAIARGVVLAPGGRGVFPGLTVDEHLLLASWTFRRDSARVEAATDQVLRRFPALADRRGLAAGALSGGEQQMLLLAQAFMLRPRLLLIDELSLGLAPTIVAELSDAVRELAGRGTTIILVEQSVNLAITLANRALFMEKGQIRYDGPTKLLLDRPDLARSVFLRGASVTVRETRAGDDSTAPAALELDGLTVRFGGVTALDGVSFSVPTGDITGLIGTNGAGKTTIFDVATGFVAPDAGAVRLLGRDITTLAPDARARLGLGRSFQSCRLFPSLTVRETIAVALERHIRHRSAVMAMVAAPALRASELDVNYRVTELISVLNLERFADSLIAELSTGTRRVVDLATAFAHEPSVLLLDEPSSGIAQREAEALGPLLLSVREQTGAAMLVIEHDVPLLATIADHLVALDAGRVVARGRPDEVLAHPEVVARYLGTSDAAVRRSGRRRQPLRAS